MMKSTNHCNRARRSPKSKPNQMKAKERKSVDRKPELSIPVDAVIEILSWLPFKTLQRFKCVCKLWLCLLTDDSYFGKLHCERVLASLAADPVYGIRSIDCWVKGTTFPQAIYECFYGNHPIYSFRNLFLRLKASGFVQWPQTMPIYGEISICNGLYSITRKGSSWFKWLWPYNFFYGCSSTLVLAPTTKAVQDVMVSARSDTHVCVDGNSVLESHQSVLSGKKIVVGTPGCVLEIMPRYSIGSDCIQEFVLYDADELFARGYKDQVYDIFKLLPRKVRVALVSEWMPREAFEIPQQFWNQKEGQWNTYTPPEAPEKAMRSSRSLWVQQSIEVKHSKKLVALKAKKLVALKATRKSGKQR